jgi:hypothetical protein
MTKKTAHAHQDVNMIMSINQTKKMLIPTTINITMIMTMNMITITDTIISIRRSHSTIMVKMQDAKR